MPLASSEASLSHFPIVSTHDPEVMRESLMTYYGATKFDLAEKRDFFAQSCHAKLDQMSIGLCSYTTPTAIEFPECNFVRLQVALQGSAATKFGSSSAITSSSTSCVTPSLRTNRIEFGSNFKQLFLRIDAEAIQRKMTALLGARPNRMIEFSSSVDASQTGFNNLKDFLACATRMVASQGTRRSLFLQEIEEAIIVGLLETLPHSHSEALAGGRGASSATMLHVKRVEDFICANWHRPLAIEDLAHVAGVGVRSVFVAFKRCRGYTPAAFIKSVRLENARLQLQKPDASTTVTRVATECGFGNLGHFSRDYLLKFGELPSATLGAARR